MKLAIIHSVSGISANKLQDTLRQHNHEVDVFRPFKDGACEFRGYDCVISLGCSAVTYHKKRLNTSDGVLNCVSKGITLDLLNAAGIPAVQFVTSPKEVPDSWEVIVGRPTDIGRKSEGLEYFYKNDALPNWEFFSEYYPHRYEYRITVFDGKVIGRYYKRVDGPDWLLNLQPAKGFIEMDQAAIAAAKTLGIFYCGFDIVANSKKDFRIIEANSGAIITDEALNAFCQYFKG